MGFENEVKICKRVNNTKRPYLVLNQLQCKHVPCSPLEALNMFDNLATKLQKYVGNQRVLVVGFAETATAIGASVAMSLGCDYVNTTREVFDAEFIEFTESHSHATEQKLIKFHSQDYDRIIFVEDEVTTGNTIMKIVNKLLKLNPNFKFTVASLLNGMSEENFSTYKEMDIEVVYLIKLDNSDYADRANAVKPDGTIYNIRPIADRYLKFSCSNTRKITDSLDYEDCLNNICAELPEHKEKSILVIGTEECMYPAIHIGAYLEGRCNTVVCHSTTRSPIAVSNDEGYPLNVCYKLPSCYDSERKTFIYNLKKYDEVIIVSDADSTSSGMTALIYALKSVGNDSITIVSLEG